MKILSIFVAFLENINFTNLKIQIRLHKKFACFVKSLLQFRARYSFGVRCPYFQIGCCTLACICHTNYGRPVRKSPSVHCTTQDQLPIPNFYVRPKHILAPPKFSDFLIFEFIGCPYSVIYHISMYLMVSWPDLCPLSLENVYLAFLAYHMVLSRDLGY